MSYNKCLEKYENLFHVHDLTDYEIEKKIKEGTITKKRNDKTTEINEVENLDSHMTSFSKCSSIIENLYMKRKLRHEELMKKLACDLNEVNLKVEENIRISSRDVKAHMKNYKDWLSEKLKSLDTTEVASYDESVFVNIQNYVDELKSSQLKLVEDLYDDLRKFENMRSTENERIFQLSFQEIEKTAYVLPYELQYIIEHEALKMNQLTLNNRRFYEDLKLKLTLITEHTFKSFMDEVLCLKEKWVRYNKQKEIDEVQPAEDMELTVLPQPQIRLELKGHLLPLTLTSDKYYSIVNTDEWIQNVTEVSSALEITKDTLVELYRRVTLAVQKNMRDEYEELRKSLLCIDVVQFEERTIQPIVLESSSITEEDILQTEVHWQWILKIVRNELNDTYTCLANFGELWNRHVGRLCESKILVLKAVEKTVESNIISLQELEVKVNLALDALRQEPNEANLESQYNTIVVNLDAIKKKLESDYTGEVKVIEDFYNMMDLEADVLSSEVQEFIFLNIPEVDESEIQFPGTILVFGEDGTDEFKSCIKMEELLSEIRFLKSWRTELRNVLENFANNTRERVAGRAEYWVSNRVQEIARKYQSLMEMHHKRYERIRIQIYEVRREEIHMHQTVFDEHKAGVEDFHNRLAKTVENFYDKFIQKLEENRVGVASSIAEAKKESRASGVRCSQTQIQKQKAEFMTEVAMRAEQTHQEIEFRAWSIQQSNLKFMKSIKLFHENGNYDADEAKAYITLLENIDKESSNEVKLALRETRKKETELLQKASEFFDEAIRTLMQLAEELNFYASVKNVIKICENDFYELSAGIKADFDSLKEYYGYMQNYKADQKTCLSQGEEGLWFLLIATLYKNICNLFYAIQVPDWLESTWKEIEGNDLEKGKVQIFQGKEKIRKPEFPVRDYKEEIFEASVQTNEMPKFMQDIWKKCWNYMENLQRSGYAFYQSFEGKSLIRGDLLKSNYEEFCKDVCQLVRFFILEYETVWLHMVHGILPILGNVKTMLKTYFEKRIAEYGENVISILKNFDIEFTSRFSENICHMLIQLQGLDNKLLPLYGYHRNSHLLSILEEEVVEKTAQLELDWEIFIQNYSIKLKSIRQLCTTDNEDYQTLKLLYTDCKDALFDDKLGKNLLDFIDGIINRRGFIRKIGTASSSLSAGRESFPFFAILSNAELGKAVQGEQVPQRPKLKLHDLDGVLMNADMYFNEIEKIIRRETTDISHTVVSIINMEKEDWMNLLEPKLGLLREVEEFEDIIDSQRKRIKIVSHEIKELFQSKMNLHKEILFKWLDRWKGNLAKNFELYTVKYPQEDDSSNYFSEGNKDGGKN